jgi:hypothetical protein
MQQDYRYLPLSERPSTHLHRFSSGSRRSWTAFSHLRFNYPNKNARLALCYGTPASGRWFQEKANDGNY